MSLTEYFFFCQKLPDITSFYLLLHKAEIKPISYKDTGLVILVFGSRHDAHRRWWHTGTIVQKVNLLGEMEGIWKAPTRILSYLYTNIIYIKYNIKIAIFFFSEVILEAFLPLLTHPRQTVSVSWTPRNYAIFFTRLYISSPFLHEYNPLLNRLLPFRQSHSVCNVYAPEPAAFTTFTIVLFIRMLQISLWL